MHLNYFETDINIQKNYLKSDNSEIYISYNDTIEHYSNDKFIKFNLVRSKINFLCYYVNNTNELNKINLPGELIDISIPHYSSHGHLEFYNNIFKNIIDINYNSTIYKTYSLEYFTYDLKYLIFEVCYLPWINKKYVKRLNRLLFLYFINTLIKYDYANTNNIINDILQIIDNISFSDDINYEKILDDSIYILNIIKLIHTVKIKRTNIVPDIDIKYFDFNYYLQFITIIKKSLENFKVIVTKMNQYNNSSKLLLNNITNINNW